jgi:hypothetical protein
MDVLRRNLLFVFAMVISGCSEQRTADFDRQIASPSNETTARFAGYQPRGTIEGYLTLSFSPRSGSGKPEITLGHMLGVRAGWLDNHTFVLIYDQLEQRVFSSPVYPTGDVSSEVRIVTCNRRYVDCGPITGRLAANRSIAIQQFPEGTWPVDTQVR